jgi:predicted acylesterase/phospholipase RssA
MKFLYTQNRATKLILVSAFILISGCAQLKTRDEVNRQNKGPVTIKVPTSSNSNSTSVVTPSAPTVDFRSDVKVAVILGPGGYRAMTHAQILKELIQAKIPVQKVVGIEWGALAAAFFALEGKAHEAEWRLYKLDNKQLESKGFFNFKSSSAQPVADLRKYLSENLGRRDISSLKVKFSCPQFFLKTGVVGWTEKGNVADIVENCLAYPPRWSPSRGAVAATLSTTEATDRLKREGYNVIILVNVLPDGELLPGGSSDPDRLANEILWEEARRNIWSAKSRVTDTIELKTKGGLFDLSERKSLTSQAEKVGRDAAKNIAEKYGF